MNGPLNILQQNMSAHKKAHHGADDYSCHASHNGKGHCGPKQSSHSLTLLRICIRNFAEIISIDHPFVRNFEWTSKLLKGNRNLSFVIPIYRISMSSLHIHIRFSYTERKTKLKLEWIPTSMSFYISLQSIG